MTDGWVPVKMRKGSRELSPKTVTFYPNNRVRVPLPEGLDVMRADWEMHPERPHLARLHFHEEGRLFVSRMSRGSALISKSGLESFLNRRLVGRYRCTVEDTALVVDLSEEVS